MYFGLCGDQHRPFARIQTLNNDRYYLREAEPGVHNTYRQPGLTLETKLEQIVAYRFATKSAWEPKPSQPRLEA